MAKTTRFGIRGLCGAVAAALFLGLAHSALASDQPQWVRQLGTSGRDEVHGVATDGDGNVYIAGSTEVSYDEGTGNAWVAKYSAAGALRWKRQFGTSRWDKAHGVATDGDGNVYIAGTTTGSLGGPNQGAGDAWVRKYSAAGALRWKRQLGTSWWDEASGVATDGDGNVYIGGWTDGSLGGPNQGDTDAWVAKYSAAGALRWKRQFGTSVFDYATGVATDRDGNVYIVGLRPDQYACCDAWAAKYSAVGALRWKWQFGTPVGGDEEATGVATDSDGNVYIGGEANAIPSIWKLSTVGALLWKRRLGTSGYDDATGVATDGDGAVYIAGETVLGNPDGNADAFVAKYSAAGALRWRRQLGTSEQDVANGVATDGDGNVYIGGWTYGSLGGPHQGGVLDAFVANYSARP